MSIMSGVLLKTYTLVGLFKRHLCWCDMFVCSGSTHGAVNGQ